MRSRWAGGAALAIALAACAQPGTVPCGDRTCPANTVCEPTRLLCLTADQTTACTERTGLQTGNRCTAGNFEGICQDALCLSGCGDGALNDGEECDDGNFASHDGCSSGCLVEIPGWQLQPEPWTGVVSHSAVFFPPIARIVMFGGASEEGLRDQQWQRAPGGTLGGDGGWVDVTDDLVVRPPARRDAMMAFDSTRNVLVLFGGTGAGGALAETWEYRANGASPIGIWEKKQPSTSPPARSLGAMVFHEGRGKMVLFGGYDSLVALGDTWEYDGTTWSPLPGAGPSARFLASATYDSQADELVLFGGAPGSDQTWTLGTNGVWTLQTPSTKPAARAGAPMQFSPTCNCSVLFSGSLLPGLSGAGDTWEYANGTWTQRATTRVPPARSYTAMTFDPFDGPGRVILVGGSTGSTEALDDVWSYDGQWSERSPEFAPQRRIGPMVELSDRNELLVVSGFGQSGGLLDTWVHGASWVDSWSAPYMPWLALAYDRARKQAVAFGGGASTDDTYQLTRDARQWVKANRTWNPGPLLRQHPAMGWDGTSARTVLFGGNRDGVDLGDTWEFDGTTWTQTSTSGPSPAIDSAMAWHVDARRLVLFDRAGDTWSYVDHAWTMLVPATAGATPVGRTNAGFTYDSQRQRLVLAGGIYTSGVIADDVWELDVTTQTWQRLYVPPGGPLPRASFGFAQLRPARSLVLFGGATSGAIRGDLWFFQYRSSTPEELCSDGTDEDGDLQVDGVDPDCNVVEVCESGGDEDFDGAINGADPDCQP